LAEGTAGIDNARSGPACFERQSLRSGANQDRETTGARAYGGQHTKGNRQAEVTPAAVKAAMATLAKAQQQALANSEWVGTAFASRARAMHSGEEDHAPIHGQASVEEAKALADDGVPVAPLPFPVVPPEACN
jgi:hypothetical protein